MADPARAKKVADRIKVIVAEHLEHRVRDERLGFVTITDVRVTGDLQHATIFYTVFGGELERVDTAAALESAKGKIRSAVGKQIGIRLTPVIEFIPDALPEGAAHLEDVIVATRARDAELARVREGAAYAGDADPYRKPVEEDEDEDDHQEGDQRAGPAGPAGPVRVPEATASTAGTAGTASTVPGDVERG
ncbi:30S ribosome-binding factor RbfA [Lapillicoccus sp.]|uniref:30S ribosome-binding factor RbfA n=1 Tax=Lapillicoccus sp. TaxID=1909287 RepID=UPI0039837548